MKYLVSLILAKEIYDLQQQKMMTNLLEWQPITISLFLGFFTGTFLCIFFVIKILFFGSKINPINGLYLLNFLVMGILIPYLVRPRVYKEKRCL